MTGLPGHQPPASRFAAGPDGAVEYLPTGAGPPVSVFVHGLAAPLAQARIFASGVPGTRVFVNLRGHGGTAMPRTPDGDPLPGDHGDLAAEVRAVAAETGADRALGVSLGAAALVRAMVAGPEALARAVLVLPPRLDAPAAASQLQRFGAMADAVDAGDVEGLARALREGQPAAVRRRPDVVLWSRRTASEMVRSDLSVALRAYPATAALPDLEDLAGVGVPVLVIGQEGDDLHPAAAARQCAAALPRARLEVLPAGAVPWTGRDRLRELIAGFLSSDSDGDPSGD